jgi:hypothetical protein
LWALFGRVEAMPVRSAIYVLDDDCHRYRFLQTQFITEEHARGAAVRLIEAKC